MKVHILCLLLLFFNIIKINAQENNHHYPVNKHASKEARELLNFLYSIQGKETLSGMHNVIGRMSVNYDSVHAITGKYPAIWGSDFGFSGTPGDIDYIGDRKLLVATIKKEYHQGAIIVMTYHEANPLIGEPCKFNGGVISQLTDQQWKELLTPGTAIYEAWRKQMDKIAAYLIKLKKAHIPIIFRPYHEMNGNWFWWGGRKGPNGSLALYQQLFNYYTKKWKLNNILWAWTPDKPWHGVEDFYPGNNYVDILGCDIYPMKDTNVVYRQNWYDRMYRLANGKPLALAENSVVISDSILEKQPWIWFMSWGDLLFKSNSKQSIIELYENSHVLDREEVVARQQKKMIITK